jgi:hypothetical protein
VLLGLTVFGGMLTASVIAIFLIPVTFYVVEKLSGGGDHRTPGAPSSEALNSTDDGQRPTPVLKPEQLPVPARLEGEH